MSLTDHGAMTDPFSVGATMKGRFFLSGLPAPFSGYLTCSTTGMNCMNPLPTSRRNMYVSSPRPSLAWFTVDIVLNSTPPLTLDDVQSVHHPVECRKASLVFPVAVVDVFGPVQ